MKLNFYPSPQTPCPANGFHLNRDTPDYPILFDQKSEEWENNHPDDPTGERYLREYQNRFEGKTPTREVVRIRTVKVRQEKSYFQFYLPISVHNQFKVNCARRRQKMSKVIELFMKSFNDGKYILE